MYVSFSSWTIIFIRHTSLSRVNFVIYKYLYLSIVFICQFYNQIHFSVFAFLYYTDFNNV